MPIWLASLPPSVDPDLFRSMVRSCQATFETLAEVKTLNGLAPAATFTVVRERLVPVIVTPDGTAVAALTQNVPGPSWTTPPPAADAAVIAAPMADRESGV